jgi:hypothetical protein
MRYGSKVSTLHPESGVECDAVILIIFERLSDGAPVTVLTATIERGHRTGLADFRCWQILLQKSFRGGDRKFLEALMRRGRGDVRDHIASSKIDHGPSYWR